MTFKDFTLSTSNVKAVFRLKISKYCLDRAPKWRFFKRSVDVKFWFWDPQKAHPCAELRFFDVFCVDVCGGVLAVGRVNIDC